MEKDASEKVLAQYATVQEQFEAMNGYHWESEMKTGLLRALVFPIEDLQKKNWRVLWWAKNTYRIRKTTIIKTRCLIVG